MGSFHIACVRVFVVTMAACLPVPPASQSPEAPVKPLSKEHLPRPTKLAVALEHPALTGKVGPNLFLQDGSYLYKMPAGSSIDAASIVELTQARLCVEVIKSYNYNHDLSSEWEMTVDGISWDDGLETKLVQVGAVEKKRVPKVGTSYSYSDTGRKQTVCVEELKNKYGTVVGCARYQDEAIVDTHSRPVDETTEVRRLHGRVCWDHNGTITPLTKSITIKDTFSWASDSFADFQLVGQGKPVATWGGTGGTSLTNLPWDVSVSDWGRSTCQSTVLRSKQAGTSSMKIDGEYLCDYAGLYYGVTARASIVQSADGRIQGHFNELSAQQEASESDVEGSIKDGVLRLSWIGANSVGAELRLQPGGNMSGLGSAIVDGRCTGFSMACHRVGDVPATYKPGSRKPVVDDVPAPLASGKSAPPASGKSAPASFSMTNKSTSPFCTIDGFTQKGKKTGGNFANDKLRAGRTLSLGKLPADLAMLRVVSCDKKVIGLTMVTPSKPAAFTIVRGTAKDYGELEVRSAKEFAGSPFAL